MIIQKAQTMGYEATQKFNQDVPELKFEIIGFGETMSEAINRCMAKIFTRKEDYTRQDYERDEIMAEVKEDNEF